MMMRLFLVLSVVLLANCAARPLPELPDRTAPAEVLLAPFEDATQIPPQIAMLPFDEGRAYAILVQIPAPAIVDLSAPEHARSGLVQFLNPLATLRAGTLIGHIMAGWRCADGTLGLASKTGDGGNAGVAMVLRGWGLSAFLSEYHDGRLYEVGDINPRHRRVLREGGARIVAVEITEAGCQRIRDSLIRYRAHPSQPEAVYTMLRDPADLGGDGCAEFAMWLVGQGGAFAPLVDGLRREIALTTAFVGRGRAVEGPVTPFVAPGVAEPIALAALLTGDWSGGDPAGRVRVLDLELLRVTLDRAYARVGAVEQRLRADDAQANSVRDAAERWMARYPVTRPVRIGHARAVILQRS
jgi:hypothetical protein